MAKHKFPCRSCGVSLTVAETAIGGTVTCPSCGEHTIVPTRGEEETRKEELRLRDEQAKEAKARASQERKQEKQREHDEKQRRMEGAQRDVREEARKMFDSFLGQGAGPEFSDPAPPKASVSFLNSIAAILFFSGAVALVIGLFIAFDREAPMMAFIGGGIAIQCFWMASLSAIAASLAQNVFGIHEKLEKMQAARDDEVG